MVSPDLEVDVDDVVVGDREPAEAVGDRERADAAVLPVVPDDPNPVVALLDAECVRSVEAPQLGVASGPVAATSLAHLHEVDVSPSRTGMSRYAPLNEPAYENVMSSRTSSEPSGAIFTCTTACGSEYDFAWAAPGTTKTRAATTPTM